MNLSDNAKHLLKTRYCRNNERPEDVFVRVAEAVGKANNKQKEYKKILTDLDFIPNSPCLRNANYSNMNKACFVLPIEDSMDSLFKSLHDAGIIFKGGGGCGYNFSNLREEGASISAGGTSSGAISFMKIFNAIIEAVKSGGFRRGASMGILDYDHPEILNFIKLKLGNDLMTNFNLSVLVDDDFMKKIDKDENIYLRSRKDKRIVTGAVKARDIFDIICYSAWICGDPGMVYVDRVNKDNPYNERIKACNPCGEQFLFPYESCCLGSINLSNCVTKKGNLNKTKLKKLSVLGTKFLLDVNKITKFSVEQCYKQQYKYNRVGLGVMGFADMLVKMGVYYDSEKTLKIIDEIGKIMLTEAKKITPNSASVLSIAPTGSLSIIANCSASIEPIFSRNYQRKLTSDVGTISESRLGKYVRTAHEVSPDWHLRIQSRWQKWIDNGVSKTINLPHDASIGDIKDIYYKAWKWGAKGITVYRDGCKGEQVYYSQKCDGEECHL